MAITSNKLVRNSDAAVTVNTFTTSKAWEDTVAQPVDDAIIFEVEYESTAADAKGINFKVKAGGAWGSDLGDFTLALITTASATPRRRVIGPFESYRFRQTDGTIKFTIASANTSEDDDPPVGTTKVKCFELPIRAKYE